MIPKVLFHNHKYEKNYRQALGSGLLEDVAFYKCVVWSYV